MNSRIQKIPEPAPPAPRVWTSLDLIKWTTEYFQKKGIESARLEAELLLAEALGCPRIRLYVDFEKPVPAGTLASYRELVKRRAETRTPLQYLLGHSQFMEMKLKVTSAVLIPRPETELLAVWAAERAKELADKVSPPPSPPHTNTDAPPEASGSTETGAATPPVQTVVQSEPAEPAITVLDLCTGSGCLALYLAMKEPRARVIATDVSPEALTVAVENAQALNLAPRVSFLQGDLFGALPESEKQKIDLLVANPPYIDPAIKDTLQPEVREHEPAQALFADENGLAAIRRILEGAGEWLRSGAWLGVEFGQGQAESVKKMAQSAQVFDTIDIREDSNKLARFLLARRV